MRVNAGDGRRAARVEERHTVRRPAWRCLIVAALLAIPLNVHAADAPFPLLEALQLPVLVNEAREAGVAEPVVLNALIELQRRGRPAAEAALVIREEVDAVNAGAPMDGFGQLVEQKLDAGLRGVALAEAIRAEHRALGINPVPRRQRATFGAKVS